MWAQMPVDLIAGDNDKAVAIVLEYVYVFRVQQSLMGGPEQFLGVFGLEPDFAVRTFDIVRLL
jgi:hypothetical protein